MVCGSGSRPGTGKELILLLLLLELLRAANSSASCCSRERLTGRQKVRHGQGGRRRVAGEANYPRDGMKRQEIIIIITTSPFGHVLRVIIIFVRHVLCTSTEYICTSGCYGVLLLEIIISLLVSREVERVAPPVVARANGERDHDPSWEREHHIMRLRGNNIMLIN